MLVFQTCGLHILLHLLDVDFARELNYMNGNTKHESDGNKSFEWEHT